MDVSVNKKTRTYDAFLESGECSDEIIFEFDDNQKLYVSQNLLTLASPVFKAMFDSKSNFKENKERTVKMVDKSFEDFQQLLWCLHPDIQQAVTMTNVLVVAPLAEEYQFMLLVGRCKELLKKYLESSHYNDITKTHQCLLIFNTVVKLNYKELVDKSVVAIAKFGSDYLTGKANVNESLIPLRETCKQVFQDISSDIKVKILLNRLEKCDKQNYVH